MLFDLVNMSDQYTFHADSLECAALVTILLGSGQYSAKQLDGDAKVPFFMFGGTDEWFSEKFGRTLEQSVDLHKGARLADLVGSLESVLIGDRQEYERTLPLIAAEKREEWIAGWHDRHRSSMNDIGGRARRLAEAVAARKTPEAAPAQVFVS